MSSSVDIDVLVGMLHRSGASCVIYSGGQFTLCRQRGVKDLYELMCHRPDVLRGASVADKVVGKGAAALMVAGGVSRLHADVMSRPALEFLAAAGVEVAYGQCVDSIINRAGTDVCPVEKLCRDCATAAECLPLIARFLAKQTTLRNQPKP